MCVNVCFSLVRVEIRAPPPARHDIRSGCFVLDLHEIEVVTTGLPEPRRGEIRFQQDVGPEDTWYSDLVGKELLSVQVRRLVTAYARPTESRAAAFLSVGSKSVDDNAAEYLQHILLAYSPQQSERLRLRRPATLFIRLPSAHVSLTKDILDGLQLWADDSAQWSAKLGSARASGSFSTSTSVGASRNTSMIGSRYFAKRTGSGSTESEIAGPTNDQSEFVIKLLLNEGGSHQYMGWRLSHQL